MRPKADSLGHRRPIYPAAWRAARGLFETVPLLVKAPAALQAAW